MALTEPNKDKIITLLSALNVPPTAITFTEEPGLLKVEVSVAEAEAGRFIGRGASVLDSLQLLLSLMLRQDASEQRLHLDIGGYRARRLSSLVELAKRLGDEALASGVPQAFPPLSPSERRDLHLLYSQNDTLTTYSEGEGLARRLYIAAKN